LNVSKHDLPSFPLKHCKGKCRGVPEIELEVRVFQESNACDLVGTSSQLGNEIVVYSRDSGVEGKRL
jgi:hypothetical protein